jgi:hypothetical protein
MNGESTQIQGGSLGRVGRTLLSAAFDSGLGAPSDKLAC